MGLADGTDEYVEFSDAVLGRQAKRQQLTHDEASYYLARHGYFRPYSDNYDDDHKHYFYADLIEYQAKLGAIMDMVYADMLFQTVPDDIEKEVEDGKCDQLRREPGASGANPLV
jgi:hypothetical protein